MAEKVRKELCFFISSTFVDLAQYREAARAGIIKIHRHVNDKVFYQRADPKAPEELSIDQVKQSDYVILILAHRYGTIPPNETRSITEIEFDTAEEAGIPVLPFFVKDDYAWNPLLIEEDQRAKLREFKKKVAAKHVPAPFTTPESLELAIAEAISTLDRRYEPPPEWSLRPLHPISAIDELADLLIHIGLAEDGLPMALDISRSDDLALSLSEIAKAWDTTGEVGMDARLGSYIKEVVRGAEKTWKTRGIHSLDLLPGGVASCYISNWTLAKNE